MTPRNLTRNFAAFNVLNDFGYFGFLAIQLLLLEGALTSILPAHLTGQSVVLSMAIIASQLLWQIVLEAPTGAFADKYGRALAIAASFFCRLVAVVLTLGVALLAEPGANPVTLGFICLMIMLAQILMGTGEAFLEGSIDAWINDEHSLADQDNSTANISRAFGVSAIAQNTATLASSGFFLSVWHGGSGSGYQGWAGVGLSALAACVFFIGGILATVAWRWERFQGKRTRESLRAKIAGAVGSFFRPDSAAVRWVVVVLVAPFPCWVLLSWFFPSFIQHARSETLDIATLPEHPAPAGSADGRPLPADLLMWFGLTLGVARVVGAWLGNKLTSCPTDELNKRMSVFIYSVSLNVGALFASATFLLLIVFDVFTPEPIVRALLFLSLVAIAKASEEVVKLGKNRLLALLVDDDNHRATILSLVSLAQNAFALAALILAAMVLVWITVPSGAEPILVFFVCGVVGVVGLLSVVSARRPMRDR